MKTVFVKTPQDATLNWIRWYPQYKAIEVYLNKILHFGFAIYF